MRELYLNVCIYATFEHYGYFGPDRYAARLNMCPVSKNKSESGEKPASTKKSSPKRRTKVSPRKSGESAGRSQSRDRKDRGDRSESRRTRGDRDDKKQAGKPKRRSDGPRSKDRFGPKDQGDRPRPYDKRSRTREPAEPEKKTKAPKVKKVRTEFGTRVARRITCTACGKSDTIDFVPQDGGAIVCRQCAYEKYNVHDPDRKDFSEYDYDCSTCGVKFKSGIFFEDENEIQCSNCYMGIETKQDDKLKRGQKLKSGVVRVKRNK